jgi:hypothetical protein
MCVIARSGGPNGIVLVDACEADGDAPGVDEEISLNVSKTGHPVVPVDAGGFAGKVNGTRRGAIGDEGEATTACTALRLVGEPVVLVEFCKVALEGEMEKINGRDRVASDKRTGQEGNGVGQGKGEISGGGHDDNKRI